MNRFAIKILLSAILLSIACPVMAQSEDRLMLSISPPLIKNNVSPGQIWQSAIKLVNNNAKDLEIYVQVLDFVGGPESGTVEFLPQTNEAVSDHLLSKWISIGMETAIIPPLESIEVPFIIEVPETAEPGGHYAAILAGTKPPEVNTSGSSIKISSLLASLLLLNVSGETIEEGRIREFSTNNKFYAKPRVDFTVRFENLGNLHIQPQGEIRIFNQFNKERGQITINHNSEYGNVLPNSTRKWVFEWQGKESILDMGRYRAELIIGYGGKTRATVDQTLYFWVIDFKILGIVFFSLIAIMLIIVLSIRFYIRRAILRTQRMVGVAGGTTKIVKAPAVANSQAHHRVLNLKEQSREAPPSKGWSFLKRFILFLILILLIITAVVAYLYYKDNKIDGQKLLSTKVETSFDNKNSTNKKADKNKPVLTDDKDQEDNETESAKEENNSSTGSTSSPQVNSFQSSSEQAGQADKEEAKIDRPAVKIKVLNGSGQAGAASQAAKKLEAEGYAIEATGNADNFDYKNMIIRYQADFAAEAEAISKIFASESKLEKDDNLDAEIVIIVGRSY